MNHYHGEKPKKIINFKPETRTAHSSLIRHVPLNIEHASLYVGVNMRLRLAASLSFIKQIKMYLNMKKN